MNQPTAEVVDGAEGEEALTGAPPRRSLFALSQMA